MRTISITQFLRPDGRQAIRVTDVSDEAFEKFQVMTRLGCRLTAEVLVPFSGVSLTIEHPDYGDYAGVIVNNEPGVATSIETMLLCFDEKDFSEWREQTIMMEFKP